MNCPEHRPDFVGERKSVGSHWSGNKTTGKSKTLPVHRPAISDSAPILLGRTALRLSMMSFDSFSCIHCLSCIHLFVTTLIKRSASISQH
jgi:hypothetical protein